MYLMYLKNRRGRLLFLLLLVFLYTSCGLSTYIYIYPPITGTGLSFTHDSRNNRDPNFLVLGYDIYYRIYPVSDFISTIDSDVRSKMINDGNNYFTSVNINNLISRTYDPTTTLYRPVYYYSDVKGTGYSSNSSPPVLPIDNSQVSDSQFTVSINLNNGIADNPYIETVAPYGSDTLPEKIFFRRFITDNKDFSTFNISDSDIPDTLTDSNIYVAFFVISYGFTVDLYSLTSDKPLFIGYTELF